METARLDKAAKLGKELLGAFYDSRVADIEADCQQLEDCLHRLLIHNGISDVYVTSKPKERRSALDKIDRKVYNEKSDYAERLLLGEQPQDIITDLVRARIACSFSDDVDKIANIIRKHFVIHEKDCADYRTPDAHGAFGYAALHLVCSSPQTEPFFFSGCKFEIQVRSRLMDIWGIVDWDVAYKSRLDVPYEIRRRLSSISALFYLIDREFLEIRDRATETILNSSGPSDISYDMPMHIIDMMKNRGIIINQECLRQYEYKLNILSTIDDEEFTSRRLRRDLAAEYAIYFSDRNAFKWIVPYYELAHLDILAEKYGL